MEKNCIALKEKQVLEIPMKKPRKKSEIWHWQPVVLQKSNQLAVQLNDYAPFLKNQWIFPGTIKQQQVKPKKFDFIHSITHHSIYVKISEDSKTDNETKKIFGNKDLKWVTKAELKKLNPSSILQKILQNGKN